MRELPALFNGIMVRGILDDRKTKTRRPIKPQPPTADYKLCTVMDTTGDIRRIGKHHWVLLKDGFSIVDAPDRYFASPLGYEGDVLYVRENAYIAPPNFADPMPGDITDDKGRHRTVGHTASMDSEDIRCAQDYGVKQTPSIHMPRWAARILLDVIDTRFERLQDISFEDALAEGIRAVTKDGELYKYCVYDRRNCSSVPWSDMPRDPITAFRALWDSIYAKPAPVYTRVDGKRVIDHYESYPWEDVREVREYKGKPWRIYGNPSVWVTSFKRRVEACNG